MSTGKVAGCPSRGNHLGRGPEAAETVCGRGDLRNASLEEKAAADWAQDLGHNLPVGSGEPPGVLEHGSACRSPLSPFAPRLSSWSQGHGGGGRQDLGTLPEDLLGQLQHPVCPASWYSPPFAQLSMQRRGPSLVILSFHPGTSQAIQWVKTLCFYCGGCGFSPLVGELRSCKQRWGGGEEKKQKVKFFQKKKPTPPPSSPGKP